MQMAADVFSILCVCVDSYRYMYKLITTFFSYHLAAALTWAM